MKTILGAFLSTFFLLTTPANAWSISEMNTIIDQSNFIVNDSCSGTLISIEERLILTNYHCINEFVQTISRDVVGDNGTVQTVRQVRLMPVTVSQHSYAGHEAVGTTSFTTEIVARKQSRDLAVLRIRAESIPHSIISPLLPLNGNVQRGERIYTVGNPAGFDATVVEGIVSSTTRSFRFPWAQDEDLPMIQFSGGLFGGNSGGALYNSEGYLIGVPAAGHRQANFIGLAIPIEVVWEVLAENCLAESLGGVNSEEDCDGNERVTPEENPEEIEMDTE